MLFSFKARGGCFAAIRLFFSVAVPPSSFLYLFSLYLFSLHLFASDLPSSASYRPALIYQAIAKDYKSSRRFTVKQRTWQRITLRLLIVEASSIPLKRRIK